MSSSGDRRAELQAWLPIITRLSGLGLGSFILIWQTVLENLDRPYLIGGGLTLFLGGGIGLFLEAAKRGN